MQPPPPPAPAPAPPPALSPCPARPPLPQAFCKRSPGNVLCKYIPALDKIDAKGGGDSTTGLKGFGKAVESIGDNLDFHKAQVRAVGGWV